MANMYKINVLHARKQKLLLRLKEFSTVRQAAQDAAASMAGEEGGANQLHHV